MTVIQVARMGILGWRVQHLAKAVGDFRRDDGLPITDRNDYLVDFCDF
jgi:hypothetical protein